MTARSVGRGRRGQGLPPAVIVSFVIVALVIAAGCGSTTSPTPSAPAATATGPDASPGGSDEGSPTPRPTAWPGNAVLGINALGVADGQIDAAITDFNKGIATEDLALMREAADGLAGLDVLRPNLDRINIFEPMRPFADRYGSAILAITTAARSVRSAIDAHDAAAIATSSQALIASLSLYTAVQPELAAWVEQSIEQQRLLLN